MQYSAGNPDSSTLKAFAILELIVEANVPVSLDDLTQRSGLPKPTVYRILQLLVRGELASRAAPEKRYSAGGRVYALANHLRASSPQRARRRLILGELVDEIGETCNFTMLNGSEVVYLERVETPSPVRVHMEPGSRVPLHCTASGKLFLSQLTSMQLRRLLGAGPLLRYTDRTVTSVEELEHKLKKVRADGIGIDVGEYLEGSVCLAVPVADSNGRICTAVAVHGPAPRMTLKKGMEYVPAMKLAAIAMASTLSGGDEDVFTPPLEAPHPRRPFLSPVPAGKPAD